ncbi:MAG: hypothetical protein HRT69_14790 [Flavobacteriaceae bacterium]|nr:hypothetical protein [Flavobacteriaceae bacterium]
MNELNTSFITSNFIFGCLFILFSIHLILYFFYRKNKYNLYYAIAIIIILIKFSPITIGNTESQEILKFVIAPYILIMNMLFINSFFGNLLKKKELKAYYITGIFISIYLFIDRWYDLDSYLYVIFFYQFFTVILTAKIFFLAIKAKQKIAYYFLTVLFVWVALTVINATGESFQFDEFGEAQYTIVLFYFSMTVITTYHFAQQMKLNESLTESLQEINTNLDTEVKRQVKEIIANEEELFNIKTAKITGQIDSLKATLFMKRNLAKGFKETLVELSKKEETALKRELKIAIQDLIILEKSEVRIDIKQSDLEKVDNSFYKKLDGETKLSNTERDMCVYLKIGLSNAEIANLFNTSVNTIHVTRSRLRKKLKLERKDNLEKFIQSL